MLFINAKSGHGNKVNNPLKDEFVSYRAGAKTIIRLFGEGKNDVTNE